MGRLDGKVAIVTGASRGIGRATAKLFAAEGATVAVLSRTSEGVERVVEDIREAGGTALGVICDVGEADQIRATVDKVIAVYGRIDILVNNAFDGSVVLSSVLDLSVEQLQRNFDTGPIACLRFMQACYPYLKQSGAGRVINFASMAATIGLGGYGPYNMAKEAVRALTRTAAREWGADNITVNNILPIADTWGAAGKDVPPPTNALARFGSPEGDIAPVVLFLASKDSQFITGYSLTPDGGAIIDSAR
ncbi:SDR family oxidoreductase [Agrobacterium rhizogenes]|uniref:SDR family oxidoreductase n=2 Tax=unclassified Rhizobium TaxID=2613769 RepID=A0AAU7SPY9_9HYPH|nr:SDR family oxidoreductase [Rhizobium rhizogenes]NTJ78521.1 SDR family oxidoreductase [Rhizobium rhizogenes]